VFPLTLLREQAEAAKILVQEFDSWFVELPTLDEFVRGLVVVTHWTKLLRGQERLRSGWYARSRSSSKREPLSKR